MKVFMFLGGALLSAVNLLPLPWKLRLLWFRFLYFLTVKGTLIFPSTLRFAERQNIAYKMGKQEGEDYESLVQLEKVLEYLDSENIPIQRVKEAVHKAGQEKVPPEQLGAHIARTVLGPVTADEVLGRSLQATRY